MMIGVMIIAKILVVPRNRRMGRIAIAMARLPKAIRREDFFIAMLPDG